MLRSVKEMEDNKNRGKRSGEGDVVKGDPNTTHKTLYSVENESKPKQSSTYKSHLQSRRQVEEDVYCAVHR